MCMEWCSRNPLPVEAGWHLGGNGFKRESIFRVVEALMQFVAKGRDYFLQRTFLTSC